MFKIHQFGNAEDAPSRIRIPHPAPRYRIGHVPPIALYTATNAVLAAV